MLTSGFQATQFGYAVDEVNKMLKWRLSDEPVPEDANEEERDPAYRAGSGPKSSWASSTSFPAESASSSSF